MSKEKPSLLAQVERQAKYKKDWDSYGARPPTSAAIEQAKRLAKLLDQSSGLSLHVAPVNDGGMQFEIAAGQIEMEIEIAPRGNMAAYIYPEGWE